MKLEMLRKQEEDRLKKIEKAEKLEQVWALSKECRRFLKENTTVWIDHNHEMERIGEEERKLAKKEKAKRKKEEFLEGQERKRKVRTITEMLTKIPKVEAERIEQEVRKGEKLELQEMKKNIWKKWRGKNKIMERKVKIPTEEEKIDKRIIEMTKKIEEYKLQKENKLKKRDEKKRNWKERNKIIVEDHWAMLRWCQQYIEENKCAWERRRQLEQEEREMNEIYDEWMEKDTNAQIEELKKSKEKEDTDKEKAERRTEKARQRRKLWKQWRTEEKIEYKEAEMEERVETEDNGALDRALEMMERAREWRKEKLLKDPTNMGNNVIKGEDTRQEEDQEQDQDTDPQGRNRTAQEQEHGGEHGQEQDQNKQVEYTINPVQDDQQTQEEQD